MMKEHQIDAGISKRLLRWIALRIHLEN